MPAIISGFLLFLFVAGSVGTVGERYQTEISLFLFILGGLVATWILNVTVFKNVTVRAIVLFALGFHCLGGAALLIGWWVGWVTGGPSDGLLELGSNLVIAAASLFLVPALLIGGFSALCEWADMRREVPMGDQDDWDEDTSGFDFESEPDQDDWDEDTSDFDFESEPDSGSDHADPITAAYGTLGVSPRASDEDIKSAYRRLIKEHHPDRVTGVEAKRRAHRRAIEINTAYDKIKKARNL